MTNLMKEARSGIAIIMLSLIISFVFLFDLLFESVPGCEMHMERAGAAGAPHRETFPREIVKHLLWFLPNDICGRQLSNPRSSSQRALALRGRCAQVCKRIVFE